VLLIITGNFQEWEILLINAGRDRGHKRQVTNKQLLRMKANWNYDIEKPKSILLLWYFSFFQKSPIFI